MLAAGDTFRAAAVEQLKVWGARLGAEVVSGAEGADAAALAFDAIKRAKEQAPIFCSWTRPADCKTAPS